MNAIGYVRVSTEGQAESGLSLESQREAIEKETERRGWDLGRVVRDVASGASMDRPGLDRALGRLGRGDADVLVVARLDRLSRTVYGFAELMARANREGWQILCLSPMVDMTDPFGRAMAQVASVFSELERELISMRTKEGLARAKAKGKLLGRQRFIADETLDLIEREVNGGATSGEIAYELNLRGIPTFSGKPWTANMVRAARSIHKNRTGESEAA